MRCSPANTKNKDMATKQEKEVAKQKAIKGGMPSDVADKVFRMQMGKDKSGIDSSHSFPMKQAYTIRMSPMLQTKNEDGTIDVESYDVQLPGGTLGKETVSTTTETIPGQTTTTMPESQGSYSKVFSGFEINEKGQRVNPINKNVYDNLQQFIDDAEKNPARPTTTTTPNQTVETKKVEQQAVTKDVTPLSNFGERQNMRRAGTNVRLTGKYQRKSDRFENRADKFLERKGGSIEGLSEKDRAKYDRLTAKSKGFQNVANIGLQRGNVFSAQAAQGGAGNQQTTVDKVITPGQREALKIAMPPTMQMKFKGKKSGYKK
jgi:hypothetical protein